VIADHLRRATLSFDRVQQLLAAATDNTICAGDDLPGNGRPLVVTNARDVAEPALPALLPFLFRDRTPPAAPAAPTAVRTGTVVTIAWPSGDERDLAGYDVYRDGTKLTTFGPTGTTTWYDLAAPAGATYTIVAVDTSANRSTPSPASNVA
jgi:hypothetical protein